MIGAIDLSTQRKTSGRVASRVISANYRSINFSYEVHVDWRIFANQACTGVCRVVVDDNVNLEPFRAGCT